MSGRENICGDLLASLDLAVFEESAEGLLPVSPLPDWVARCFGGEVGSICERSDFLEHFLEEAREHWAGKNCGTLLRSGIWQEREEHFEALAIKLERVNVLGIQLAGQDFETLSTQVQRSNELALERSKLNRETQRRVVLLDCVVHDLSNPMATILVNLQHIVKRLADGPEREAARVALDQVERQRAMLRSVVGLFSADLGLSGEDEVVADVGEATAAAVRAQLDAAMECGVALVAEHPDQTLLAVAQPVHLLRAIENLVVNAVRHSPRDSTVTVRTVAEGDALTIAVEDEGDGVAEALAGRLFEPFEGGGVGGGQAGLGLFFCKRAVARWGGEIGVEANLPRGARFWMRLRRAPA